MKLSFTLCGGFGDYILKYLGLYGSRLAYLSKFYSEIDLRLPNFIAEDFLKNSPFFSNPVFYEEQFYLDNRKNDDIEFISNIIDFPKLIPSLWLSEEEEFDYCNLKKPYGVFHPFASKGERNLSCEFDIFHLAQWIADTSGIQIFVLGQEDYNYSSKNVKKIVGSTRFSCKVVEGASFFVGSHSSMQCAAWVYNIPSFCIGPGGLLLHNIYAPSGHDKYVKLLYRKNNIFMLYDQKKCFADFFDHFLRQSTSLLPQQSPSKYPRKLALLGRA